MEKSNKFFVKRNEQIRISKILLVRDGVKLGIYDTYEAIKLARNDGLDLVEVAPHAKPPVCVIVDYGKYKFDQQKKKKEQERKSGPQEKEISFRYVINEHDLTTKAQNIKKLIAKGERVKITVKFKGRENAHKDQGMEVIQKCLQILGDTVFVEKEPSLEGGQIICKVAAPKGK